MLAACGLVLAVLACRAPTTAAMSLAPGFYSNLTAMPLAGSNDQSVVIGSTTWQDRSVSPGIAQAVNRPCLCMCARACVCARMRAGRRQLNKQAVAAGKAWQGQGYTVLAPCRPHRYASPGPRHLRGTSTMTAPGPALSPEPSVCGLQAAPTKQPK